MQVLDIVVHGLKHFPEQRRIPFGKGHTVVMDDSEAGSRRLGVLAEALRSLLVADADPAVAARLADAAQPASWLGATLRGDDGAVYRVHWDLNSGALALHRANGNAFEVLTKDPAEVARVLSTAAGVPTRDAFLKLFAAAPAGVRLSASPVPTPAAGVAAGLAPQQHTKSHAIPPGVASEAALVPGLLGDPPPPALSAPALAPVVAAAPAVPSPALAHKRARAAQLRTLLHAAQEQQRLEFELDGIQRSRYELEEKLRPLGELEGNISAARALVKADAAVAGLPKDFLRQFDVYERQRAASQEEARRLEEQFQEARQRSELTRVPPPFMDQVFQAGTAVSAGVLALAFLGAPSMGPGFRYVGFLHLAGLGAVAWSLWMWIGKEEAKADLCVVAQQARERRAKALRTFDLETAAMRRMLAELAVKDDTGLGGVRERVAAFDAAKAELQQAEDRVAALKQSIGPAATPEELARLSARQAEIEARLSSLHLTGNEKDLRDELAALEAELAQGGGEGGLGYERGYGGASPGRGGSVLAAGLDGEAIGDPPGGGAALWAAPGEPGGAGPSAPAMPALVITAGGSGPAGPTESVPVLLRAAGDLLGLATAALGAQVATRVAQYLSAFTDRRLVRARFTDDGEAAVADPAGAWRPAASLEGRDGELLQLSVRLALVEECARRRPAPAVVDGWFTGLAELKFPLVAKMLQFLGSVTQVIHFASRPALAEGAESRVTL